MRAAATRASIAPSPRAMAPRRACTRPSTLPARTTTARSVLLPAPSDAFRPRSIGVEVLAMLDRDRPLTRSATRPCGEPSAGNSNFRSPDTRPARLIDGNARLTSANDTLSSRAVNRRVSPQSPDISALPSALDSVTGARCQPAASRVITAGPDNWALRPSKSPLPPMLNRSGAMSALLVRRNGAPLLPATSSFAVPRPSSSVSVPSALASVRLPRSSPAIASVADTCAPVAGRRRLASTRRRSMLTGVANGRVMPVPARSISAACTPPAAANRAVPARP